MCWWLQEGAGDSFLRLAYRQRPLTSELPSSQVVHDSSSTSGMRRNDEVSTVPRFDQPVVEDVCTIREHEPASPDDEDDGCSIADTLEDGPVSLSALD